MAVILAQSNTSSLTGAADMHHRCAIAPLIQEFLPACRQQMVSKCYSLGRVMLLFLHVGYVFLAGASVSIVDCVKNEGNGVWYLQEEPSVECFTYDVQHSEWARMAPWAAAAIVLYTAGIPLIFGALFYLAKYQTHRMAYRRLLGFMYSRYKPQWFAFELVVMLRKGLILIITILFSNASVHSAMRQVRPRRYTRYLAPITRAQPPHTASCPSPGLPSPSLHPDCSLPPTRSSPSCWCC